MSLAILQRAGGWRGGEPSLKDVLADPLIRVVMAAYRVDPVELEADLREVGRTLRKRAPLPAECVELTN